MELDEDTLGEIAFVGLTLGPFFSYDPKLDEQKLEAQAQAFCALELPEAAYAWPFVSPDVANTSIGQMQFGLAQGLNAVPMYEEYRRLFVGPAAKVAPPWGSVYTDKDMVVFGESTIRLREWLRVEGISVAKGASDEPEDHIGTLLSLMGWIAKNRPEALIEFLQQHVLTWSSHFLEIVEENAMHPFYRGLATLTRASLEGIQRQLGIVVEYPRYYR